MSDLGNHTITVIDLPPKDVNGDPTPGAGTESDVEGCYVQQRASAGSHSSHEETGQRNTVITERIVFAPPGTAIKATSKVRWRGDLYQVDGEPADWDDDDGIPHHLEVQLRRVEG